LIICIRHAAVANPDGLVYARLPGFHLSERGRAEAAALGDALAFTGVSAVFASPLERAVETAEEIARQNRLAVTVDDRLLEWSFWVGWQGLPWARIRERDPAILDRYGADPGGAWPQDPLPSVGERVLQWAEDAAAAYPEGLVIGVSHEAPLVAALLMGSGRSLAEFHAVQLPHLTAVRLVPEPVEVIDLTAQIVERSAG
jgi:broad specificity phosphatase PhoE